MRDCPYDMRLQRIAATPRIGGDMETGQILMVLPKTTRLPAMATSSLTSIRRIGHAQLHVEVRSVLPSNGLNLTFAFLNASYDSNSSPTSRIRGVRQS